MLESCWESCSTAWTGAKQSPPRVRGAFRPSTFDSRGRPAAFGSSPPSQRLHNVTVLRPKPHGSAHLSPFIRVVPTRFSRPRKTLPVPYRPCGSAELLLGRQLTEKCFTRDPRESRSPVASARIQRPGKSATPRFVDCPPCIKRTGAEGPRVGSFSGRDS
jgi:hypothetical protein